MYKLQIIQFLFLCYHSKLEMQFHIDYCIRCIIKADMKYVVCVIKARNDALCQSDMVTFPPKYVCIYTKNGWIYQSPNIKLRPTAHGSKKLIFD